MLKDNGIRRVVITGPESTGKTALTQALADKYGTEWIPEYAREYIQALNRPYVYEDVVRIAQHQMLQEELFASRIQPGGILFLDTWLIITKVWFDLVFKRCPEWIPDRIRSSNIDLFLVCSTDLPWIADDVRENGGEKREELLQLYCQQIRLFGFDYEIVNGLGPVRLENAIKVLSDYGMNYRSVKVV